MAPLRIGFVTCVQLGLSCMEEIDAAGGRLDAVLTLTDEMGRAKSGRVHVDAFCADRAIPLAKFRNVNEPASLDWLRQQDLDWLFIIGWSQIAHPGVLALLRRGAIGMHPTLLPEGRGRSAVPWAILKDLRVTGVSMFKLDAGVDTGPLLGQEEIRVEPRETATTLYGKVEQAHRTLIRRTWPLLVTDALQVVPQDHSRATVWPGRTPADGRLDLTMTVGCADRLVRAVTHPYPGAYFDEGSTRWRIWSAAPAIDLPTDADAMRLRFADGDLAVLQAEQERIPG